MADSIGRMPVPETIEDESPAGAAARDALGTQLTAHCNQKCDYCYNAWREDGGVELTARHRDKLLLRVERPIRAEEALPPPSDAVVAAVGLATLHLHEIGDEFQVGVAACEEGLEIAPVEGIECSVMELHVWSSRR